MKFLKEIITLLAEAKDYELVCDDSAKFLPRFLNSESGNEYGCSNDFNIWTGLIRSTPRLEGLPERYAGSHIHLGYKFDEKYSKDIIDRAVGRAFDFFLTFPSDEIKYTHGRRETYGSYGSTRITPYGIECRTLGGFFTNDEYLPWITERIEKMFIWLNEGDNLEKISYFNYQNAYTSREQIEKLIKEFNLTESIYA
jgi:hypothetical protein